jgi:hypothetical protein
MLNKREKKWNETWKNKIRMELLFTENESLKDFYENAKITKIIGLKKSSDAYLIGFKYKGRRDYIGINDEDALFLFDVYDLKQSDIDEIGEKLSELYAKDSKIYGIFVFRLVKIIGILLRDGSIEWLREKLLEYKEKVKVKKK